MRTSELSFGALACSGREEAIAFLPVTLRAAHIMCFAVAFVVDSLGIFFARANAIVNAEAKRHHAAQRRRLNIKTGSSSFPKRSCCPFVAPHQLQEQAAKVIAAVKMTASL